MRFSICIPTYDRRGQLLATLEHIRPQLDEACEIVVADNGSGDGTADAVRSWQQRHREVSVRLVARQSNAGFDHNLIDVVAAATGEYCWLLGDDDLPYPHAIREIRSALERHPGLPLLLLNYQRRDEISGRIDRPMMVSLPRDFSPATANEFFFHPCPKPSYFKLLGTNIITLSTNVIRRADWLAEVSAAAPWIGHSMIHVFVITAMLAARGPGLFLAAPQLAYTCNNARPWPNDVWHDYRTGAYGHLRDLGYDKARIAAAEAESITHRTWRDVVRSVLGPWTGRSTSKAEA
ncbi:MAG: glycosyltransferase family 2 protein [Planctomycetes bacterium]|nr:glycosyltransferase family 2 protein [Planctomycetota bacterium]